MRSGSGLKKKALARIWRGGELPNRRPSTGTRRWAGQLSTERCSCPVLARVPTGVTGDSCGAWDSLRVLGGWSSKLRRSTPMIIIAGVAGPSGRQAERVCKGSAPSGHCPLSRLLLGVPSRGPSPRPSACGPRQPLDGLTCRYVIKQSTAPGGAATSSV